MCKGTSPKSLLELPPSNISSEAVSSVSWSSLIVINCLVLVHVLFSLADAIDCPPRTSQLRCSERNTVVLWCESPYPWKSWAGLRQQEPSGKVWLQTSWVYPSEWYDGLPFSVYAMTYARIYKGLAIIGLLSSPGIFVSQLYQPKFRNPLLEAKSLSRGRVHYQLQLQREDIIKVVILSNPIHLAQE